jgi:hypothetical protein
MSNILFGRRGSPILLLAVLGYNMSIGVWVEHVFDRKLRQRWLAA